MPRCSSRSGATPREPPLRHQETWCDCDRPSFFTFPGLPLAHWWPPHTRPKPCFVENGMKMGSCRLAAQKVLLSLPTRWTLGSPWHVLTNGKGWSANRNRNCAYLWVSAQREGWKCWWPDEVRIDQHFLTCPIAQKPAECGLPISKNLVLLICELVSGI